MIHTPPLGAPSNSCYPRTIRSRKNSLRGRSLILDGSISLCKSCNSQRSPTNKVTKVKQLTYSYIPIHLRAEGSSPGILESFRLWPQAFLSCILRQDWGPHFRAYSPRMGLLKTRLRQDRWLILPEDSQVSSVALSTQRWVPNEAPTSLEFISRKKNSRRSESPSIERLLSFSVASCKVWG